AASRCGTGSGGLRLAALACVFVLCLGVERVLAQAPTPPTMTALPPGGTTGQSACAAKLKLLNSVEDFARIDPEALCIAACKILADAVYATILDRYQTKIYATYIGTAKRADVQPKDNDSKGGQGSPAQSQAVPSVQPVATAGGSVALSALLTPPAAR